MPRPNPFLNPDPARVFLETPLIKGLWDAFPVSKHHALLVPQRVVPTWFDASPEEQQALTAAIAETRQIIEDKCAAQNEALPDGYNIGINSGAAAGQTIFHLHVHVIPRYEGDVPDPRGGVRYVIPDKANYLVEKRPADSVAEMPVGRYGVRGQLFTGGKNKPLLTPLKKDLEKAQNLDLAVAFLQESGINSILLELQDLLTQRNGACRLVTGDYLQITHPNALETLLNLAHHPEVHPRLQLRIFQTELAGAPFHPKAYLFTYQGGKSVAYVGSSNLSRKALTESVEWNYRFEDTLDPQGLQSAREEFESLFCHRYTTELTYQWLNNYRAHRPDMPKEPREILDDAPQEPATPHPVQEEALKALERTRAAGNEAGLVVLATGLGKTWLSAFDSLDFSRILFIAHREEILNQAMKTFRRIRPEASFGQYHGTEKTNTADVLFASIQTLSRKEHLQAFSPTSFDYIVVDEFHHAAAATYRKVIDYFEPQFLLGLTATPERSDGGNLLALCGQNLVFRCDVAEGMTRELLCPMRYFGVPDVVDYQTIPWRSKRFDPQELTHALATRKRAQNCWEQYQKLKGERTIGFCSSQTHADYMAEDFRARGARAVAVHSGAKTAPRAGSLEKLKNGELDIIFCVDMFNEGVDLPTIDTVLMLRPTESRIIWLQQLGRGLRKSPGKTHVNVLDYIGNHRSFLMKLQSLWSALGMDRLAGDKDFAAALKALKSGELTLPVGCEVTYDLEAIDILKSLLSKGKAADLLQQYYQEFDKLHGRRPTALETYQDGFNPRAAKQSFGSWLGLVKDLGGLSDTEVQTWTLNKEFLDRLEVTQMSKSYKMVLLAAMLRQGNFPGETTLDQLTRTFAVVAGRSARLKADISTGVEDLKKLRALLLDKPIQAWTGGKGTGGVAYFELDGETFRTVGLSGDSEALAELTREILEWRLGQYLDRQAEGEMGSGEFLVKVNQTNGKPFLFPLDRKKYPQIPVGQTTVRVGSEEFQFRFVKVAVNVATQDGEKKNVLAEILRELFGENAGASGTRQFVRFQEGDGGVWEMVKA